MTDDVNFMKNLQDGQNSPRNADGYGSYRKKYDADEFLLIQQDCDTDLLMDKKMQDQKEQKHNMRYVIEKYNKNSDRILASMGCQRKEFGRGEYLDEELLRKE